MILPMLAQLPGLPGGSAQPDSTAGQAADSALASIDRFVDPVSSTGRLLLDGQWGAFFEAIQAAAISGAIAFAPRLASALFVGLVFYGLYRIVLRLVEGLLRRTGRIDRGLESLGVKTLRVIGRGFVALIVFSQLGVNLSALFAGIGIAGLAIGFAAKDSLENFISGLTILLDRPFAVGDWITIDGYFGQVENITLRSTRIRTLNEETVVFPSVDMVTHPIVNHSAGGALRVDVPFGIAYKEDVARARSVVLDAIDGEDERIAKVEPRVVVKELGDSSVGLDLHIYVDDPKYAAAVRASAIERIKRALDDAGIEIPFPHLQLRIDHAEGLRAPLEAVLRPSA